MLNEQNSEKGLKNTIIHELLHTCDGCFNHGEEWKKQAQKVNREYGYQIQRVSTAEEKGIVYDTREIKPKQINHIVHCCNCGKIYTRNKNSKLITHTHLYRCGKCNGNLELIY